MTSYLQDFISQLCKEYNLALYEEFDILEVNGVLYDSSRKYRFIEDGLQSYGMQSSGVWVWADDPLPFFKLARGQLKIRPCKYIPKKGQRYSYIEWSDAEGLPEAAYVTEDNWTSGLFDYMNLALGNVFANAQIAKNHKYEITDKIIKAAKEAK